VRYAPREYFLSPHTPIVIPAAVRRPITGSSGDPVFQRRQRLNREAAAYWIVRSSRTMTASLTRPTKLPLVVPAHRAVIPARAGIQYSRGARG
jgi:hypothetical protein